MQGKKKMKKKKKKKRKIAGTHDGAVKTMRQFSRSPAVRCRDSALLHLSSVGRSFAHEPEANMSLAFCAAPSGLGSPCLSRRLRRPRTSPIAAKQKNWLRLPPAPRDTSS